MSDYVKIKAIALPIDATDILEKCHTTDIYDCEDYLYGQTDLYENWDMENEGKPYFEIESTDKNIYINLVLYYEYGAIQGNFAYSWDMTDEDIEKYKPYFDLLNIQYDVSKLRKVAYCWYNAAEPPDFYDPPDFENI